MERSGVKKTGLVLGLLVLAALGIFAWWQYSARVEAEQSLGLDASRVVAARFSKAAEIKVGTLSGNAIARSEDEGFLGIVPSEQTTAVPFTVDYFVNFSGIRGNAYRWDEETKTLTIDIPDVRAAKPNIDETAGTTKQEGLYISRRASLELARETSKRAVAASTQAAKNPEYLAQARENARAVIANMAKAPLMAAGLEDVRVAVSFPWEPKEPSDLPAEQWDQSRRIEDVLNESRSSPRR